MSSLTHANSPRIVERLIQAVPLASNRDTMRRYLDERRASGVKPSTLGNDANHLRRFFDHLGEKPVEKATREDVVAFFNLASQQRVWRNANAEGQETVRRKRVGLGATTLAIRKVIVRLFFKWLRGTDDYPPEVKGLKATKPKEDPIPAEGLLTSQDLHKLLQAQPDAREKAIIATLYESGLRAAELCALNIGSVQFDQYGARLTLPKNAEGLKTGSRIVRLYAKESVPYLQAWYERHPLKHDPKAPLFVSMSRRAPMVRLAPNALWQFTQRARARAKLEKEIRPHLFRHTAATERARLGWTEGEMRAFFGWSRTSDMPSYYVHLAGKDYEEMDLRRRGLKVGDDATTSALAPRVCRVCKADNLATNLFCQNCRNPVSPKAESELHDQMRQIAQKFVMQAFETAGSFAPGVMIARNLEPLEKGVKGDDLEQEFIEWKRNRGKTSPTIRS